MIIPKLWAPFSKTIYSDELGIYEIDGYECERVELTFDYSLTKDEWSLRSAEYEDFRYIKFDVDLEDIDTDLAENRFNSYLEEIGGHLNNSRVNSFYELLKAIELGDKVDLITICSEIQVPDNWLDFFGFTENKVTEGSYFLRNRREK